MNDAANVALVVLAIMAVLFAAIYVIRSPWEHSEVGRIYALKSTLLALVMVQIALSVWISTEYPGRGWARLIIYTGGALAYIPMIASLVRHQRQDRDRVTRDLSEEDPDV